MNKRAQTQLIVIVLLILSVGTIGVLAVTGNLHLGDISSAGLTSYSTVYEANWGHMCCEAGSYKTLAGPRYADDLQTTSCSENVDKCDLIVTCAGPFPALSIGYCAVKYNECNLDGSGCIERTYSIGKNDVKTFLLPAGKTATFLKNSFISDDRKYYTWERKGAIYNLQDVENGKILLTNGCRLSDSLKGQVLSGIPNDVPRGNCEDGTPINYMIGFIPVATKTYKYSGKDVLCLSKTLYNIDTDNFGDGTPVRLQGDPIKPVDCCPTESNCGTDFTFAPDVKRECTYSTECDNGGDLYGISQTTAGYFVCESGTCVKKTKPVECTSDAVCQTRHGEGYACGLSGDTKFTCIKAPTGTYCGDGYCDIGESKSTCPADCSLECLSTEKVVTTTKKVDCLIGWPLNIRCSDQVTKECKANTPNWLLWISIILVIIILLLIFGKKLGALIK